MSGLAGFANVRPFAGGGVSPGGPVVPLTIDGLNLKAGDAIWKYRGVTAFTAPMLFARGEIGWLDDYYGWAKGLGANIIRVFPIWQNTKSCPRSQADYDRIEGHLEHAKTAGLYAHLVGETDQKPSNVDVYLGGFHQQIEHHVKFVAIAKRVGNVLYEISNEDTDPDSGGQAHRFPAEMFAGILTTRSTWAGDEDPQRPGTWLDWSTYHAPRVADFAAKGKTLFEIQRQGLGQYPAARIPAVSGEPTRIAEGTTPRQHADDAMVCELFGAGRCIHGGFSSHPPAAHHESDLQNCHIPTGLALECCEAVSAVWKSNLIDPRCAAEGRYVRGTEHNDGDCPIVHRDSNNQDSPHNDPQRGALRSFFMELDGKMYGGAVDPGPQHAVHPRNGWRVVEQGGFQGNVIVLER